MSFYLFKKIKFNKTLKAPLMHYSIYIKYILKLKDIFLNNTNTKMTKLPLSSIANPKLIELYYISLFKYIATYFKNIL